MFNVIKEKIRCSCRPAIRKPKL